MIIHEVLKIPHTVVNSLRMDFLSLDIDDVYKKKFLQPKILQRLIVLNPSLDNADIEKFVILMYDKKGEI